MENQRNEQMWQTSNCFHKSLVISWFSALTLLFGSAHTKMISVSYAIFVESVNIEKQQAVFLNTSAPKIKKNETERHTSSNTLTKFQIWWLNHLLVDENLDPATCFEIKGGTSEKRN